VTTNKTLTPITSVTDESSEPQTLEEAIILQAVEDWRKAYRYLHSLTEDNITELNKTTKGKHKIQAAKDMQKECEEFFNSDAFDLISPMALEGHNLLKRLIAHEEEEKKKEVIST